MVASALGDRWPPSLGAANVLAGGDASVGSEGGACRRVRAFQADQACGFRLDWAGMPEHQKGRTAKWAS
nr:unnamed protein product [Digitaria exilis]